MLKWFARAAGFLTYLFITLEMMLMITPFAVYYGSPSAHATKNLPEKGRLGDPAALGATRVVCSIV